LESTDDPARLRSLQERSRRLLATASAGVGQELRLALLRGSYRGAEKIAESHRLRQSTDEDVERAIETLAEIIPKLNRLRNQVNSRVNQAERRLMRTGGNDAQALADEAEAIERLRTQCTFVTAWALYYQSWLNNRPENARVAEELFAELLSAESSRPQPAEISVDFRAMEAMARSILGMALCKSVTSSSNVALSWIELLTHPMTFETIREQTPIWRLVILFEHGEYLAAGKLLDSFGSDGEPVPLAWIRLVAVHALEAEHGSRAAADLARIAMTTLAARGELRAVLDLAGRYGVESLGTSGFAFRYVRGVQFYQDARTRHGDEQPVDDEAILGVYRDAVAEFETALQERDAVQYPEAAASCRWLIGWCRFFEGRFLDARTSFEQAAERLGKEQAAEALWMAVVSLDYELKRGRGDKETLRAEMAELIDDVLVRFPLSRYTAKLRLKRALQREPSADVVEELLTIGSDSDVYEPARRRAAQILYQLFRTTAGEGRLAYGNEYLGVALPLLSVPDKDDARAADLYIARSRRVLEVALTDGIVRLTAAGRVLADLESLASEGTLDLARWDDELSCRRIQERLLADDAAAAAVIADALWSSSGGSVWSRLAERTLFRYGLARWKSLEPAAESDSVYLALVVDHGLRVLEEFKERPKALSQKRILAWHAAVAEAMLLDFQRGGDPARAAQALALYERLLTAAPTDARFLHATAILARELSNDQLALSCWRTLAAGTPPQTDRWYEARFHQISLLADIDPDRARAVMDQHKQLNPDYGPDPWGVRLEQLDLRIPNAPGERQTQVQEPPS
jgi:tetratricopeptide (TPR) repeat protein